MAVFKLNICKFNNCDLIFNNLENLIRHIETHHINYDPKIMEQFETQQPTCLPLSYVLKFFADDRPVEEELSNSGDVKLKQSLLSPKHNQQIANISENTVCAVYEEVQSKSNSSGDSDEKTESWVSVTTNTRVFKNLKVKKTFKCHCGKSYGTSASLRKHAIQCHNAAVITAQVKEILHQGASDTSSNVAARIQPYASISLRNFSSSSASSLKTLVVSTKPANGETVRSPQCQSGQQPQVLKIHLTGLEEV